MNPLPATNRNFDAANVQRSGSGRNEETYGRETRNTGRTRQWLEIGYEGLGEHLHLCRSRTPRLDSDPRTTNKRGRQTALNDAFPLGKGDVPGENLDIHRPRLQFSKQDRARHGGIDDLGTCADPDLHGTRAWRQLRLSFEGAWQVWQVT